MKILAVMGSLRKYGGNYKIVKQIEQKMKRLGKVDFEYLFLADASLELCKGCTNCRHLDNERCKFNDDAGSIKQKMLDADGIILSSPVYAGNMSWLMKNFVDRFSFVQRQPLFFDKYALLVCNSGGAADMDTPLRSLEQAAALLELHIVGRITIKNRNIRKSTARFETAAENFYRVLSSGKAPAPDITKLLVFKLKQHAFSANSPEAAPEYKFWKERGWFEKGRHYYSGAKLTLFKRILAWLAGKVLAKFA